MTKKYEEPEWSHELNKSKSLKLTVLKAFLMVYCPTGIVLKPVY